MVGWRGDGVVGWWGDGVVVWWRGEVVRWRGGGVVGWRVSLSGAIVNCASSFHFLVRHGDMNMLVNRSSDGVINRCY